MIEHITGILFAIKIACVYFFASGFFIISYKVIEAFIKRGVIKVEDFLVDLDDDADTFVLFLLSPIIFAILVVMLPFLILFGLIKDINFITKQLKKHSNKELISTKSYKIKKLLYEDQK